MSLHMMAPRLPRFSWRPPIFLPKSLGAFPALVGANAHRQSNEPSTSRIPSKSRLRFHLRHPYVISPHVSAPGLACDHRLTLVSWRRCQKRASMRHIIVGLGAGTPNVIATAELLRRVCGASRWPHDGYVTEGRRYASEVLEWNQRQQMS